MTPPWRIWIDTGGTFTDCLALDRQGNLHRAKVLSTSAVRGRVVERLGAETLRLAAGWPVPENFFRGFTFTLLDSGESATATEYDPVRPCLVLDRPCSSINAGATFELRSPEEAPLLAARLVTGTPLLGELPEIAMRLATTRGTNALL
ncbi:MAG TPA: hydantoinase/oxoprolinase N-terminal domain-containing protein, partial [Thermoanaerobaculia bacterium]